MTIGDLNQRITLQKYSIGISENGYETESWIDYKTVWASVSDLSGREFYQVAAVQAEKTVKFLIRFVAGIDCSMRIQFGDRLYNIVAIDNMKYDKKLILIKTMEVNMSG
ncbi:phage head closure protein [Clostridium polynesiense]|uniref:phage head closure protein n=1 Tax=Clostridium polynesiense TaxID=1325933 RepID=UPI00058F2D7D|nr:phage head closure protein [Clostridium polynesiense]